MVATSESDHDWELDSHGPIYGFPFVTRAMWVKHHCTKCGTKRAIVAGIPCFDPPGEPVKDYGQLPPPCPPV